MKATGFLLCVISSLGTKRMARGAQVNCGMSKAGKRRGCIDDSLHNFHGTKNNSFFLFIRSYNKSDNNYSKVRDK